MKQSILFLILSCSFVLLTACKQEPPSPPEDKPQYSFRHDANLQITGVSGQPKASFKVEIAQTAEQQMQGLKYRDSLAADQGMLFIFARTDYHSFWMQDTYLPLDMIFIDKDGRIVHIEENTIPFDENPIFPERPCQYVLELPAGTAEKQNLKLMDTVKWQKLND